MEVMLPFTIETEQTFKVKENIGSEQRAETEIILKKSALLRDVMQQMTKMGDTGYTLQPCVCRQSSLEMSVQRTLTRKDETRQ